MALKAYVSLNILDSKQINTYEKVLTLSNKQVAADNIEIIKIPAYVKLGDSIVNFFVHRILKQQDIPEYHNMLQFVYFSHLVAYELSQNDYQQMDFASQDLKDKVLLQFHNEEKYESRSKVVEVNI